MAAKIFWVIGGEGRRLIWNGQGAPWSGKVGVVTEELCTHKIMWPYFTGNRPPVDSTRVSYRKVFVPLEIYLLFSILSAISMLIAVLFLAINLYHRKTRYSKLVWLMKCIERIVFILQSNKNVLSEHKQHYLARLFPRLFNSIFPRAGFVLRVALLQGKNS